jgi:rhodanese-related sulfurtransferase
MTQEFLIENIWLIALAVGSGLMLIWPVITKGGSTRVNVPEAILMLNQRKAVLVDIREDDAVNDTGTVLNAKRIAIKDLKDQASTLSKAKDTPLIVLCQTGTRSSAAATILKAQGFANVFVLDGGAHAWKEAGMPMKMVSDLTESVAKPRPVKARK